MTTPNQPAKLGSSPIQGVSWRIKFNAADLARIDRIAAQSESLGRRPSAAVIVRAALEALERQLAGLAIVDGKDALQCLEAAARGR